RVVAAVCSNIAGDGAFRVKLKRVGAAGEGNGVAVNSPNSVSPVSFVNSANPAASAFDAAVIEDGQIRANDPRTAVPTVPTEPTAAVSAVSAADCAMVFNGQPGCADSGTPTPAASASEAVSAISTRAPGNDSL